MMNNKFAALVAVGTFLSLGSGAIAQQQPTGGTGMQNMPIGQMQQQPTSGSGMQNMPMKGQMQPNPTNGSGMQNMQMKGTRSSSAALNATEKNFLTKSAQGSLYEFAAAQLAVQKAQSSELEQYGLRLMKDHGTYNQALMQLARQKNIALPVDLDAQNKNKLARLQQLKGKAFARQYLQENTQANAEDVKDLQKQSSTAKDPQLKAFVAQFLPVQQEHTQLALALKGSTATSSSK